MAEREIFVTNVDLERLSKLLDGVKRWNAQDREHFGRLEAELERAHAVPSSEIPADVVTMNSEVAVRDLDSGAETVFKLVFPPEADVDRQKISILAPVGTAVLGYQVGDTIEWKVPGGIRRLQIERVLYQPGAAGEYDR
jgi:regulator of nucleoside diphosphate kinase